MTNHVYLLMTPETDDDISKVMQTLDRHYVRYFNYTYQRTGILWEGRFESYVICADHYLLLRHYYTALILYRAYTDVL